MLCLSRTTIDAHMYAGAESKQQTVEATQAGKQRVLRMAQDEEAHTLANFAGSIELETRERDVSTTAYTPRLSCCITLTAVVAGSAVAAATSCCLSAHCTSR
jgi:Holliday junction resolvasome RuvABC endonuclease subunit